MEKPTVYPVYILDRVVSEIFDQCHRAVPDETMGRLVGYRYCWQEIGYTKIVDWIGGTLEKSHTHARFTMEGTRECEFFLDERYGNQPHRPKEVGIFHSHPFGMEPHFSPTDYETFLAFPYDQPGNVFVLIDPLIFYFKVFIVSDTTPESRRQKLLQQVPWICYHPAVTTGGT